MAEFKGTKGEWFVDDEENYDDGTEYYPISTNVQGRHTICNFVQIPIDGKEAIFDAHLIAAAPDLLEALQNMVDRAKESYISMADIEYSERAIEKALNNLKL